MIEQHLKLDRNGQQMDTFVCHPEAQKPYPLVLFLMDAPGKREELHDMARRIASVGYYVLLPNLYYRTSSDFVVGPTEDSRQEMFEHMYSLSNALVCEDVAALLDFADNQVQADIQRSAVIGYCMSGPFAFAAAAKFNQNVKAAASIHGVLLYSDKADSPHLDADKINAKLYFACAETDAWAPPEMINKLDQHLASVDLDYEIEWFPNTEHGFVFPKRPAYQKAGAERHWEQLFKLFARL